MAETTVVPAGAVTLTRVLYLDAVVPPEAVGLDLDQARAVPWCDERWATDEGIVATAAAWVATSGDRHVVFDPFRNADDILHDPASAETHYAAISDAFAAAGIPVEFVTDVVLSHVEGLGMIVRRSGDAITPFFPNATLRLGSEAVDDFDSSPPEDHWTNDIWRQLLDDGMVTQYHDGDEIAPGVVGEHTGAHNPGHYVFHFGDGPQATFVGHLAVSPLHLSTGPCEPQHGDAELAWQRLSEIAGDGRVLIAPLWPSPGAGRLVDREFVAWDADSPAGT
jgi:hypothetical protein